MSSGSSTNGTTVPAPQDGAFELQAGDLLLKRSDGSVLNRGIQAGQSAKGFRYPDYVHAAIAGGTRQVVEMGGDGIVENDILTTDAGYTYAVFRCRDHDLAAGAGETAKMLLAGVRNDNAFDIRYTCLGAFRSLGEGVPSHDDDRVNKILDTLGGGGKADFFCSGFAVWCYVVALEQTAIHHGAAPDHFWDLFDLRPEDYSPARLYEKLLNDRDCFDHPGILNRGRLTPA